ncbi:hypothetical protein MRX96_046541 [Rhipicephalus microplus]
MAAVHLESGARGEECVFSVPERDVRKEGCRPPAQRDAPDSGSTRGQDVRTRDTARPRGPQTPPWTPEGGVRPSRGEARARAGGTNCALDASGPGGGEGPASRRRCRPSGRDPDCPGHPSGQPRSSCQGAAASNPPSAARMKKSRPPRCATASWSPPAADAAAREGGDPAIYAARER